MQIAHLSDLHLSGKKKPENTLKAEKLLAKVAESRSDHLVITGDLTHNAETDDLEFQPCSAWPCP
jgi:3',5'-cyclic AMP phosphodiesterase CpdA